MNPPPLTKRAPCPLTPIASGRTSGKARKLIFLITEDWFFCSHFLSRATALVAAGYEVAVATRVQKHQEIIEAARIRVIPLAISRRSVNPFHGALSLLRLVRLYRAERPDVVHHVALKPILFGSIAARLAKVRKVINAPVGFGYVFASSTWMAKLLKPLVVFGLRRALHPSTGYIVFENPDDRMQAIGMDPTIQERAVLIRGAGVDLAKFKPMPRVDPVPKVLLPARMLRDKGIGEFVKAARLLHQEGIAARFVLVGGLDQDNPSAISRAQLDIWCSEKVVEWWGHREDMPTVLGEADVVCLPSYREGLPKALIEAAACGCPIVTTDVPGCREVVRDEENGIIVPAGNVVDLARAIKRLVLDPQVRRTMGEKGRAIAEKEFSEALVVYQTLDLYSKLFSQFESSRA